jgi:hypothetical protein
MTLKVKYEQGEAELEVQRRRGVGRRRLLVLWGRTAVVVVEGWSAAEGLMLRAKLCWTRPRGWGEARADSDICGAERSGSVLDESASARLGAARWGLLEIEAETASQSVGVQRTMGRARVEGRTLGSR